MSQHIYIISRSQINPLSLFRSQLYTLTILVASISFRTASSGEDPTKKAHLLMLLRSYLSASIQQSGQKIQEASITTTDQGQLTPGKKVTPFYDTSKFVHIAVLSQITASKAKLKVSQTTNPYPTPYICFVFEMNQPRHTPRPELWSYIFTQPKIYSFSISALSYRIGVGGKGNINHVRCIMQENRREKKFLIVRSFPLVPGPDPS